MKTFLILLHMIKIIALHRVDDKPVFEVTMNKFSGIYVAPGKIVKIPWQPKTFIHSVKIPQLKVD